METKLARIKVYFKDGTAGYYVDKDHITSFPTSARTFTLAYAQGFCQGLNDSIHIYGDELTDHCAVEIIQEARK